MKKISLIFVFVLIASVLSLPCFAIDYPQSYGEIGNTLGSAASVIVSSSKMSSNLGDEVTFSVRLKQVDKAFNSLLIIPVYNTNVFEMKIEANGDLYSGLVVGGTITTPDLSSQSYTDVSAGGKHVDAFDCIYSWSDDITSDGIIFKFTLKSIGLPTGGKETEVGVYLRSSKGSLYYAEFDSIKVSINETSQVTEKPTEIPTEKPTTTPNPKPTDEPAKETVVPTDTPVIATDEPKQTADFSDNSTEKPNERPAEKETEKPKDSSGGCFSRLPMGIGLILFAVLCVLLIKRENNDRVY